MDIFNKQKIADLKLTIQCKDSYIEVLEKHNKYRTDEISKLKAELSIYKIQVSMDKLVVSRAQEALKELTKRHVLCQSTCITIGKCTCSSGVGFS